jgi:hypothetical protein
MLDVKEDRLGRFRKFTSRRGHFDETANCLASVTKGTATPFLWGWGMGGDRAGRVIGGKRDPMTNGIFEGVFRDIFVRAKPGAVSQPPPHPIQSRMQALDSGRRLQPKQVREG